MKKRGEILVENVIFIVLNILFFSILILFLVKQSAGSYLLEQGYSKQIALLVDSALPGTIMTLNMPQALTIAKKNNFNFNKVVTFSKGNVNVNLSSGGGYSYHYFSSYTPHAYPLNEKTGVYVITVSK